MNVASTQPYAYYLLKVDADGQLVANTTVGSSSGITVAAVAAHGTNAAVYGAFNCQFTGLANLYGSDALFMATGTEDLFVSVHALGDLALQEAQQFGGRSGKSAGGMAYLPQGELVFSGSFQQNLIFPAAFSFSGDVITYNVGGMGTTEVFGSWCSMEGYGSFVGCESNALVDGFVARGYVQGRAPYDWWERHEEECERVQYVPCILTGGGSCGDTLSACGSATLNVDPHFAYYPNTQVRYVGPPLTFMWSTGSTTANISVTNSGTYWVDISTTNGCWQWTDTIHVVINPVPPVTWLSFGGAEPHPPQFGMIHLCDPDVTWMVASNLPDGGSWWWDVPNGTGHQYSDSIGVDTTGMYSFTVVNEFGCVRSTAITAQDDPTVPMPDLGMDMDIFFPQDTNGTDTLRICAQSPVQYGYMPTWTLDGTVVGQLPPGLNVRWCLAPCSFGSPVDAGPQTGYWSVAGSGWLVFDVVVSVDNLPCANDTLWFHETDSIYVHVFPALNVSVALDGPSAICDGDTVLLTATCTGCDTISWWTTGAGAVHSESEFLAWAPGQYMATALAADTNGCSASQSVSMTISAPLGPVLSLQPADGILCPGDSALISTTSTGTDAVWYGPQGPILGQGTSLYTAQPGSYYLNLNVQGCQVTSNSVSITSYGTPFLAGGDQVALCFPGDQVALEVMSVPGAVVHWEAPLSGTATTQMVNQPGTYTCTVTACNIATPLSIEVVYAPANVQLLTPGPFNLCPDDSVQLAALGGAGTYTWLPGQVAGADLNVTEPGAYRVVVSNVAGCSDTSAVVLVNEFHFSDPVSAMGDTVCTGDPAQLTVFGSGTMAWYGTSGSATPLGFGASFNYVPSTSTMVYVRQQEGGCTSGADSVWLEVIARPSAIAVIGPDSLCVGDQLQITAVGPDTLFYTWTTPLGSAPGMEVSIPAVAVADMGNYICTAIYRGCSGPPATHFVAVHAPVSLDLPEEDTLCEGGFVLIQLPPGCSQVVWSNGSTSSSIMITSAVQLTVHANDIHGCATEGEVRVVSVDCDVVIPNVFTPNGDGVNDGWFPTGGFMHARARIWNRWGNLVFEGDLVVRSWNGRNQQNGGWCSDGTYYYEVEMARSDGREKHVVGHLMLMGAGN